MLRKLLVYYWRESCNLRTFAFIAFILLLTGFVQSMVWHDEEGEAQLFSPLPVSLVVASSDPLSSVVIRQLDEIDVVSEIYLDDLSTAQGRLARHEIIMLVELPENPLENTLEPKTIRVYFNNHMASEANMIARMLNQALAGLKTVQASLRVYQEGLKPLVDQDSRYQQYVTAAVVELSFAFINRGDLVPLDQSLRLKQFWSVVASLISLFAMLPALLVLLIVMKERISGRHERLLLAGVSWWSLHLAKIMIGLMWLMLALLPLTLIVRQMLPQLSWQIIFSAVIPLYLTAALFCLTLAYRSRRGEAVMFTSWLAFMVAMLVGGAIYPYQLMPPWLLQLRPFSPVSWSFNLLYRSLYGYPAEWGSLILFAVPLLAGTFASYYAWRSAE